MRSKLLLQILVFAVLASPVVVTPNVAPAGEILSSSNYKVMAPIAHGNLTVFPVAANASHDTHEFLTLDEGLRSGEVIVSESGNVAPLVRPRHGYRPPQINPGDGAEVNRLVLVNNSKRALILLAGEIVTGGKQDRVIGKDRLVPAESDPIDMSVFCVEPGRWTATKANFGAYDTAMVQPAVRAKAMADKNQEMVWSEVRKAQSSVAAQLSARSAAAVGGTSSYAKVMQNDEVKKKVDAVAGPMQHDYQSVIKQLRDRNAVGVVVAVNGEIIWADIFANTSLLEKYWPKLVRSYAAEAVVNQAKSHAADLKSAQQFVDNLESRREIIESEPGLYRHTEITGDGFKAFELTSLLPKTGFDVHLAKMAD
jgi:hypothetical protein